MAPMDVSKLDRMDRIVALASAVTVIALFLPWWGGSGFGYSSSVSGFSSGYGWLGALLIIAAGVYLVMLRSGSQMPRTSVGPGVLVLGLSAIGTLLVILRWATLPRASSPGGFFTVGPRIGIYFTLIAGVVQVLFSFRLFKRSGESLPWST
jgi:hypothetical protein